MRIRLSLVLATTLALPAARGAASPALSRGDQAPTSRPAEQLTSPAALRRTFRALALLRKLPARGAPRVERISRDALKQQLRAALLAQGRSESTFRDEAVVLEALLLRPDKGSLLTALVERLAERSVIRYDARRRSLLVADDATLAPLALAHALCRALIDGRHRVERFLRPRRADGDQILARHALVAGDCAGVLIEHQLARHKLELTHLSQQEDALVERVAPWPAGGDYLDALLVAPTRAGLRFALRLRKRRGWQRFDRIYRRPPRTSEQLLHPPLFLRNRRGQTIRGRALPTFGKLKPLWQDTWGELRTRLMLATVLDREVAARAAAGWDGDLLVAYRRPKEAAVVIHLSHWDSDADAFELDNALQRALLARGLKRADDPRRDTRLFARDDGRQVLVQRVGRAVLALYGVSADERAALQREIWQRFTIGGRRLRPPR